MRRSTHRHQSGDTIVEVLLAIAVASSVLGIAYATMNRNLHILRDNQERTAASKLAQGQLEAIKAAWIANPTALLNQIAPGASGEPGFCMVGATPSMLTNASAPRDNIASFNSSEYSAPCIIDGIYHVGVRYVDRQRLFVVVRWQGIDDGGTNEVTYYYRLR